VTRPALIGLILLGVLTNAGAQLLLRWAARAGFALDGSRPLASLLDIVLRPGILGGLACYGISVVLWIYILSRAEVSFAYPFLGLGFVLVTLAAWLLLGETLTLHRLAGTSLVTLGVIVLASS
jgi:multidrug transporter EmrE-like cation transporter